ncbi:serine hydrolase domain-containing protein [Streptomyces caatingaensis]|uniref:serine hydrolase domain-containing protein n=1 Tax=Streptomyces caatingaensis TaxID=1678637 RepID=UPI0006727683|nr:serine hydrolase domain-containing protein [Streptomyces caatingaensis]
MTHDAAPQTPGLAVLVQRPGAADTRLHHGLANLELSVPVGPGTTFDAGSVGKQITAHVAVLSARRGLLGLDRPVSAYLPRFRIPSVTVADLIRHQGGVRDAESLLSLAGLRDLDHYTSHDLLELAYRQTRRCVAPGRFLYSNTGYLLLAAVLHTVHGTDLAQLARRWVFGPLGMTSARFVADPRQVVPGAASSYLPTADGWAHGRRPVALPGPGSLWCSTTDLGRWLTRLGETWPAAHRFVHDREVPYGPADHRPCLYGPGLYADPRRPGDETVFHYGHEQGFSAAALLTRSGLRVVCLANHAAVHADHAADRIVRALRNGEFDDEKLRRIVADVHRRARPPDAGGKPAEPGSDHTELGTYTCADVPGALRLTVADGRLFLWRRGTRDRLAPDGPGAFRADGLRLVAPGPVDPATLRPGRPERFTLHLDRAPGLRYHRTSS